MHNRVKVSFLSLGKGSFTTEPYTTFESLEAALAEAKRRAEPVGFTNIKVVDDSDGFGFRITGKTPGGRSGRNIAHGDFEDFENY